MRDVITINSFMPSGFFHLRFWIGPSPIEGASGSMFCYHVL